MTYSSITDIVLNMIISTKCQYALRAVCEIAHSTHGGVVTIGEIAKAQQVPQRYLEGILNQLKKGGLLEATRGRSGGYRLARDAHSVTVGDVVRLIDGPIRAVDETNSVEGRAPIDSVLEPTWKNVQEAIDGVLDTVSLSQLLRLEQEEKLKRSPSYVI